MKLPAGARRLFATGALVAFGLMVALLIFEKRIIFIPYRELELTPAELGLRFEETLLATEDGIRIHGWFLPVSDSRFTVLLCHGNAGNISHRLDRAVLMQSKLKTSVFLFDYRGYGRSEGEPNEEGTYRDGRAAHRYLTGERSLAPERLVLFGESLGAAVAVQLALELPARAVVLEAPFTSIPDMAKAVFPFLPVWPLVRTRYENLVKIPRLTIPLLVLHGERDRTVPFEQGRRLFEAAREPKRFFAIPEADHNDTYLKGGEPYWGAWRDFLESL